MIRNNQGRKGKELWTDHGDGDKLQLYTAMNQDDEAQYVASQILAGLHIVGVLILVHQHIAKFPLIIAPNLLMLL